MVNETCKLTLYCIEKNRSSLNIINEKIVYTTSHPNKRII